MTFEIFAAADGKWWWRLKAANNEIVAGSHQGRTRKRDMVRAVEKLKRGIRGATIREV